MGRPKRVDLGGYVHHVLNRSNGRAPIFLKPGDYEAFLRIASEALEHVPGMRLVSYCLMPNHWHLVLWPRADGELSDFVHWLTLTHTQRWHAHDREVGAGHLHQGRYKPFPIAEDVHYLAVCRYVERNALRAGLVARAEEWQWGSLARRRGLADGPPLSEGPVALPVQWLRHVNQPLTEAESESLRRCVPRGQPFGADAAFALRESVEYFLQHRPRSRTMIASLPKPRRLGGLWLRNLCDTVWLAARCHATKSAADFVLPRGARSPDLIPLRSNQRPLFPPRRRCSEYFLAHSCFWP